MLYPTEKELTAALKMAAQMRDKNVDPFFIAKTLLSHYNRIQQLEEVLHIADRYLNHGMSEQEKTLLLRSIDKIKEAEPQITGRKNNSLGL
ncbi:MAG: hypothetical protein JKX75_07590 [Gammaproteobacteria bacterium]|nr:hypothetical protein [Gammaproteobacteria bacterium]